MTSVPRADPLRAVIVDDEPLARTGLAAAIARVVGEGGLPPIDVAAVCANAITGLEAIRRLCPEILLVDIAMPEIDAFAMLERLEPEETPVAVIFVTAYSEHAVRAFDVEALDYVVKPVPDARLRDALGAPPPPAGDQYLQRLTIPERGRQRVVPVEEIDWIEGDTYYVRIHGAESSRLLRERLHVLEQALDPARFYRTHRSAIVRLAAIREIRAESPYTFSVLLASGARAPLSRERRRGLEDILASRRAP